MRNKTNRWLWHAPGRKKGWIAALTAAQVIAGGTGVLYALLLKNIINSAAAHDSGAFWHFAMLILLLAAGQLALRAVVRWLNELSKSTLENTFKKRLMDNILRKDYASVSAAHSGEWMNRLTNDTVVVADGYADILPGLTGMVVRLVSALVMLFVLDSTFALVLVPGGLVLMALTYAFRKVLKRLHKQMQESDGKLRVFLQERIGNLMVLKSYAAEEQTAKETEEKLLAHQSARMKKNHFSNFCNIGFGTAMHGMYLFGVVYCAYGIMTESVSYGMLTAVMQLIGQIQSPFANISGYLPRWYAMTASAERLMEIEQFPDDGAEKTLSLERISDYYEKEFHTITLRDACFTYAGDDMPVVLNHLNLEISKGEIVAFTGRSGCGKSTVLKLMLALYPLDGGERQVDGRPLTAAWRRLFAYVPQGNALMHGSIREIVSFAAPEKVNDEGKLQRALTIACAADFVSRLEHGIDTELGERGTGLSEGQMQRLAIARAIFADNPILLLDEATSALDGQTERQLLQNIRSLTDKTVVIVTHRPAALSICDRVLQFMESGVTEA
jgi:ATP-binding cassette subfamily B protein